MSTRGLYGIRKNGVDKCTYNHCDSYPDWLGKEVLLFCNSHTKEELSKLFDLIELVDKHSRPAPEQLKYYKESGYANSNLSFDASWDDVLFELEGNFEAYSEMLKTNRIIYMTDYIDFIKDSLFCEYAYIINLDEEVLEFYVGFQKKPQKNNRYGTTSLNTYYPCKLVYRVPFDELKNMDQVITIMNKCK